uniref:Uncharacterized protein n=1 Tax=Ciona intestinalis TaxID=7719 RepID=F7A528_CIOIN
HRGYIVTSPAVFRAGVDHAVSVKIFNHETPVRVNVKLVDLRENMITSVSEEVTGSGTLILKVPTGNEGKASLKICGNCHLTSGFNFYNSTPVTVVNKGTSAFVQTDKPVYKPSQTVRVNVFTVDRDLKPVGENVTAYVVAPNDVRMMQWKDLRPACCGIVNFSFPLSDQPLLGTWTIFVEMQQQSYNTTFEIQKYVLPKFEVAIIPPPFLWSNCEQVSVVAKYVFGKPVVGNLTLNMTVFAVGAFYGAHMERGDSVIRDLHEFPISSRSSFVNFVCKRNKLVNRISRYTQSVKQILIFRARSKNKPQNKLLFIFPKQQFTKDTREHFKPGLPFNGKIKATNLDGSNAVGVTVRISVSVNTENFFHQEITSHTNGVVSFTIPGLPRSSKLVWIEVGSCYISFIARVVGDSTGARYRSIFKNIYGWNSPSNCHVLVKPPNSDLTVGERAKMSVTSTCPCNFTLFYEILSRGNIIQTGLIENDICRTSLTIDVTSGMAPMSRMVVYYVRENGEGIADSVHVPVKPKLDNEVVIRASSEDTKPGRDITVSVTTDPGSCVCLALVDKSVHLMKPGYMLKPEDIFAELDEYDLDNLPFEQNIEWWRLSRSRRSTDMWWDFSQARDAKYAFLESGLVVMTDVLSLDYKVTTPLLPQLIRSQAMTGAGIRTQGQARQASRLGRRHRTFFPETWVWQCFNVSSNSENFTLTVPDSITTWQADAVSLNPNTGIGISKLQNIRAFKNFFVDFTIPYSAIRGEQVQIPLTVYNYQNVCSEVCISNVYKSIVAQVNLTVLIPPGVSFRTLNSNRMMRRLCVQAQSSQTTNVILQFNYLGNKNITDGEGQARVAARDLITRQVLVEAEGIKREYTHSIYFCPSSGGSFNEIIQLNIPTHTVPGSERAVASMIGDVMGPTLNNLNNLLRLPYGCGEQNLANFAPNIYVLKYLKQTKQLTSDIKMQALHFLQTGYQRQLTYKRNDGSYSAFGNRDASGSMWLTSFVLKSFAQAREFIYIDPNELHEAKEWIISWQDRNGSFPAVGKIWNKDIQSGVDSDVALTAYVSISLVEAGLELEDEVLAATRAREYLETKVYDDTDSYTASLTAYALSLLESVYAVRSQRRLSRMAVNENGLMHWTLGDEEYDEEQLFGFADSMKQTVVSAEVEMTAYALLTYTKLQNVTAALPIVKWLSKKRNAMGGFSSTQDTCVALQSLSEYAIHAFVGGVDLFVRLASLNMDYLRNFELNNENGEVLQTATIPSLPTTVFVEATGDGCALLQIGVTYNIPNPTSEPAFDITVHNRLITPGRVNSRTKMEACVRWNRQGSSNMAVLEYKLITGFVPDLESLQQVLDTNDVNLKRYEVSGRTILFYFDEIHSTCRTCVRFVAIRQFETGRVMPQPVVIYDYYEPAFESQVMYSLSETLDN